jgi:hypothetical protein
MTKDMKEVMVVVQFKVPEGFGNSLRTSIRIVGVAAEIQTVHLQDASIITT